MNLQINLSMICFTDYFSCTLESSLLLLLLIFFFLSVFSTHVVVYIHTTVVFSILIGLDEFSITAVLRFISMQYVIRTVIVTCMADI